MSRSCAGERCEQPGVLLVGRDHLIAGPEIESGEHRVDAVRRRPGQRHVDRIASEHAGVPGAGIRGELHHAVEIRTPAASLLHLDVDPLVGRRCRLPRDRALGAGVEI